MTIIKKIYISKMLIKYLYYTAVIFLCISLYSCDKEVSTSPPDSPVPTGFISIESNPPGSSIYLNGKITGKVTPDSMCWLKEDIYKITLKRSLYRDTTLYVKAVEGEKKKVSVDYFSNPLMYGTITCTSDPSHASIYLNEKFTGKYTPYTFTNLLPGNYLVKLTAPGCRDDSLAVSLESNRTVIASKVLNDTTVWLDYNSSNSPLPSNYLTSVEVTYNDIKWIGTSDKGLVCIEGGSWKTMDPSNSSIPSAFITCLGTDYNSLSGKSIWVGTNAGLAFYDGIYWTVYNTNNSPLPDNYITSVCVDISGNVWIGTMKGLVNLKYNRIPRDYKWTVYNTSNSLIPGNWVTQVAVDFFGKVWVGTLGYGLVLFDGNTWTVYTKANSGLPGNTVTALSAGQSLGGVWAGFALVTQSGDPGGLAAYDGKWIASIGGLPSTSISSIVLYNNIHWVCTNKGIVKYYNPNSREIIDKSNSKLQTENIKDISFDSRGYMWIATANGGLVYYKMK